MPTGPLLDAAAPETDCARIIREAIVAARRSF